MKNMFKVVLAALVVAGFVGCSASKEKMIEGKWKISNFEMPEMKEAMTQIDALPEEQKAAAKKAMDEQMAKLKEGTFEFKADKSCEFVLMGEAKKATWSLTADGSKMITDESGKKDTMAIAELTESKVVFEDSKKGMKVTLTK